MVSKLLLAVQENILKSHDITADAVTTGKLIEHYYEIRAGIGLNKTLLYMVPSPPIPIHTLPAIKVPSSPV